MMADNLAKYVEVKNSSLRAVLVGLVAEEGNFMEIWDITFRRNWLSDEWEGTIYGRGWED